MYDPLVISTIVGELLARPGQSKYLLASHLQVPPTVLERKLNQLTEQGMVVKAEVPGDDEPVFWASEHAAQEMELPGVEQAASAAN
jgi:DNA-binding HxlR family transcriptional regulator